MQFWPKNRSTALVWRSVAAGAARLAACAGMLATLATCGNPLDLCTPQEASFSFFSRGDCIFTRADAFQGHEWLTLLASEDLPPALRFERSDVDAIVEGNRRVDWPKHLLAHMANSIVAYTNAITSDVARPETQRAHFLLDDVNDYDGAAAQARDELLRLTEVVVANWLGNRAVSLDHIGRAQHLVQDAYSPAHAARRADATEGRHCVTKIKAFIRRAREDEIPGLEFHGADSTAVAGHATPQDSIFRTDRECIAITARADVERCLSEAASLARIASREYLELVREVTSGGAEPSAVRAAVDEYVATHLALCEP